MAPKNRHACPVLLLSLCKLQWGFLDPTNELELLPPTEWVTLELHMEDKDNVA